MGNDIVICDLDGTIAEIPVEAYFISPVDASKCQGCDDLRIEVEKKSVKYTFQTSSSLWKTYLNGNERKYFCHRPSFCENKPADKIKEIFSAENVLNFKPIVEVRNILWQLVKNNFGVAYISGRPTEILFSTSKWLSLQNFPLGLVACVGRDDENPIESKMKMAEIIINSNRPEIIVAYEDCSCTMKMYYEKFGAVDGLKTIRTIDKLLDMKKGKG